MTSFYQLSAKPDKAIESISKAVELDSEKVQYRLTASNLYYRQSTINKDEKALAKAIEFAQKGLTLPEAQDTPGPRAFAYRMNRNSLLSLLSTYYIEQALEAKEEADATDKQKYISSARQTIGEIKQLAGNVENVYSMKWDGLLSLVEGDRSKAVQQMYSAYEQLKAVGQVDPVLSYRLSRLFTNLSELGIRREFLESAIFLSRNNSIASYKPESILEYAEVLLELHRDWPTVVAMADLYEGTYPATDRSQTIRIRGYIGAGQLDEASEKLAEMDSTKPAAMELKLSLVEAQIQRILQSRARQRLNLEERVDAETDTYRQDELEKYRRERGELVEQLLATAPESVSMSSVIAVCRNYVSADKIDSAKALVDKFLEQEPNNIGLMVYKLTLSEAEPENISADRYNELTEKVLSDIPDELTRLIATGQYYMSRTLTKKESSELADQAADEEELSELQNKAVDNFKEKAWEAFEQADKISPDNGQVISSLFNVALQRKDTESAEAMVDRARSLTLMSVRAISQRPDSLCLKRITRALLFQ